MLSHGIMVKQLLMLIRWLKLAKTRGGKFLKLSMKLINPTTISGNKKITIIMLNFKIIKEESCMVDFNNSPLVTTLSDKMYKISIK